jgi:vacuolar protein sorting-associated protein 29
VLCWGGTHKFDAFEYMDKFFVNPGTATGAFTTGWSKDGEDPTPSFCLMDVSERFPPLLALTGMTMNGLLADNCVCAQVQGISLTLYVYQLRKDASGNETVAVEKVTYTKPVEPAVAAS